MIKEPEFQAQIINFSEVKKNRITEEALIQNDRSRFQGPRVIAITSGKGGVGKTNIVTNLGFYLGKFGKKVLILDADLGLGNLDIILGITPRYNLSHVLTGEKKVNEIIVDGPGNLKILPASSGIQEMTKLNPSQKYYLARELEAVVKSFDYLLIDTAAGISSNVLFFNLSAQEILVVATPEPTSITDAYALVKILSIRYQEKNFKLIVNFARSRQEADEIHRQFNLVTARFLDLSIEYFGYVLMDANIKKCIKKQKIVSQWAPDAPASLSFAILAEKISQSDPPMVGRKNGVFGHSQSLMQSVD
ncbi:MAG: MinD/ParA family protein [Desulfobacteraceae bacterium]